MDHNYCDLSAWKHPNFGIVVFQINTLHSSAVAVPPDRLTAALHGLHNPVGKFHSLVFFSFAEGTKAIIIIGVSLKKCVLLFLLAVKSVCKWLYECMNGWKQKYHGALWLGGAASLLTSSRSDPLPSAYECACGMRQVLWTSLDGRMSRKGAVWMQVHEPSTIR